MATADRILALKLIGDVASIDKSLKSTQGRLRSTAAAAGSWVKAAGIGLAIEGVGQLTNALGEAWGGFREGEKAAAQLGTTWDNFNVKGADLQETIDRIGASTLKLGTDDVEAMNAFNKALQATGGAPAQAMNRLRIAQDLVANGSAPNLASAMKLIQGAANGSKKVVDQFGLTAETAGGRVRQLGRRVKGAAEAAADMDPLGVFMNAFAEGLEGAVGALASGDLEGSLASIAAIGTAASVVWSDVFEKITPAMDKLTGGAWSDTAAAIGGVLDKLSELADPVLVKVGDGFGAMMGFIAALQPHLANVLTFIQPVVDLLSGSVAGGLAFVLDSVTIALQTVTDLLKGDFSGAFTTVMEGVAQLGTDLDTFFVGLPGKIAEWAVAITEEASLLGQSMFHGIQDWVAKLPERIATLVGRLAVGIANVWNSLGKFDAGGFTFAEAFEIDILGQKVGWPKIAMEWGSGDLIPNISVPEMAEGGIVSARPGGMLALLGEGRHDEAVVPLDGRSMGGGGDTYITVNLSVGPASDPVAVGREVTRVLRAYANGGGRLDIRGVVNG